MQQEFKLAMLTYVHFLVDFICAFWVICIPIFNRTIYTRGAIVCGLDRIAAPDDNKLLFWVLLYNFCAFALQLPLGMLLDRRHQRKSEWMAVLGCVLLGIAGVLAVVKQFRHDYITVPFIVSILICLGLGNALFHVGAGVRVLQMGERMTPLGIFVSTGAFGICLGSIMGKSLDSLVYLDGSIRGEYLDATVYLGVMIVILSFSAAVLLLLESKMKLSKNPIHKNGQINIPNAGVMFLLFLVVALRSFQGTYVQFSWNSGTLLALMLALCIVAGKALGGVLADRFGLFFMLVPLLLSAVLYLQSKEMLFGMAATLLFQTTMPLTLFLMYQQMPRLPGTAFGLLSFGLFVGYFPKFLYGYYIWEGIRWAGIELAGGSEPHFLAELSFVVAKWWLRHQEVYTYSVITGVSFVLLLIVFLLGKKKERVQGKQT